MKIKDILQEGFKQWGEPFKDSSDDKMARVRFTKPFSTTRMWRMYVDGKLDRIIGYGTYPEQIKDKLHLYRVFHPKVLITLIPAKKNEFDVEDVDKNEHTL